MNEKITAIANTAKAVLLYILTPLFAIAGIIYVLWHRQDTLETELKEAHYDDQKKDVIEQEANIDADAGSAVDKFDKLYSTYQLQQRTASLLGRDSGTEKAGGDPGPKNSAG